MTCFLFVTRGELEEKLSLALYHKMKETYPEVKILFFSIDNPGIWQEKGLAEIKPPRSSFRNAMSGFKKLTFTYSALAKRRNFKEKVVLWSDNPSFLLPLFLLTGKKAIYIPVIKSLRFSLSFWHTIFFRFSSVVLTNDRELVHNLRRKNMPAYFVGNLLVDLLSSSVFLFPHGRKPIYALFPREENFSSDLKFFLDVVEKISSEVKAYFILAIPRKIKTQEAREAGEKKGWHWRRSLEGDTMEGYLEKEGIYLNLTRFRGEALRQCNLALSIDDFSTIQATGAGRKVLPISNLNPDEVVSLMRNPQYLFEYNQYLSSRYGREGGIEKLSTYLLQGIVEDENFLKKFSK
ncbi:MAG TPA: hypothetical protein PK016_07540 [Candidatus Atribacteria bacterium]|nr:hypothetical protein [Candidatus Atribacteria bacterium]